MLLKKNDSKISSYLDYITGKKKSRNQLVEKEDEGVIRKVGNKWRILKKNRKDYWDAEYDTKADAEAALRAYWANKRESRDALKKEGTTPLRAGDMMLTYIGDDIDYDEMRDDVLSLLGIKDINKLVLRIADESYSDEDDEEVILATGRNALDTFYDTCLDKIKDGENDVAIYLSRFDEITNFYNKLCLE